MIMNSRFINPSTFFIFSVAVTLFSLTLSTLTAEELLVVDETPSDPSALLTEDLSDVLEGEKMDGQQNPLEEGSGEEPDSSPEDSDLEEGPATDSNDPSDDSIESGQPMITEESEPADNEPKMDNLSQEDESELVSQEEDSGVLVEEPILTEVGVEEEILNPTDELEVIVEEASPVEPTPELETEPVPVTFGQVTSLLPRELRMLCVGRDWQDEYSDRESCLKDARNQQEDYLAELEESLIGATPARGGVLTIQEIRNQLE
jgi:hypothetical protein